MSTQTGWSALPMSTIPSQPAYLSIEENRPPDNYVKPKKLSRLEQTTLKEIFKRIEKFQTKLEFDFVGMP